MESKSAETNSATATEDQVELTEKQQQKLDDNSKAFVGKWNRLISTSNWEKGAIIVQWQKKLADLKLPRSSYSDEAWSRIVGGATPQHIGRLRRTHVRFGHVHEEYSGLYWSHFYAALDWDDAEVWLEGGIQNKWSVSQMRNKRWETMGSRPEDEPRIEQIVVSEIEEETQSLKDPGKVSLDEREVVEGPRAEDPDFGDEPTGKPGAGSTGDSDVEKPAAERIRPFESFKDLPDDVLAATNSFKVAIIRHKADDWQEISVSELHDLLDALKALTTSASD